jgi:hypothetical protein
MTTYSYKSPSDGHLGHFQSFEIINSAAMNIILHLFELFFYRSVLDIVSISFFQRNFRIIFSSMGKTNLVRIFTSNLLNLSKKLGECTLIY